MLSAICFNLDQSKILSSGNGLSGVLSISADTGYMFGDPFQTSPESPGIFILLQKLFRAQPVSELETLATDLGLSKDEFDVSF